MGDQHRTTQTPRGDYVTVSSQGVGPDVVYVGVGSGHRSLTLYAMLPADRSPSVGDWVQCTNAVGRWTARVQAAGDGRLELQVPRWLNRSAQRRSIRVPTQQPVWLYLDEERVAGRLLDLSSGGAAVLFEHSEVVAPGGTVRCRLPLGDLRATVTSVRAHEHALLLVAGLSWMDLSDPGFAWVSGRLAERAG